VKQKIAFAIHAYWAVVVAQEPAANSRH